MATAEIRISQPAPPPGRMHPSGGGTANERPRTEVRGDLFPERRVWRQWVPTAPQPASIDQDVILDPEESRALVELVRDPPAPTPALRRLMSRR